MTKTKLFKTNRSQAVRLPKAVAFPEHVQEVEILKIGDSRVITPVGKRWDDFFLHGPWLTDDFSVDRDQLVMEERDPL